MSGDGICKIKPEFIITGHIRELSLECVSEKDKEKLDNDGVNLENNDTPPQKKPRLSKAEKRKLKGQNKGRPATFRQNREVELCHSLIGLCEGDEKDLKQCKNPRCAFMHDVEEYLKMKPKDIGENCHNYDIMGVCSRGLSCRYGREHIGENGRNKVDEARQEKYKNQGVPVSNQLSKELLYSLRKRTFNFNLAERLVEYNDKLKIDKGQQKPSTSEEKIEVNNTSGCVTDEDIIKLLQREKRKISWADKLYLSPLTTVGNLPFRRLCKEFGADITCGEMAMCSSLLQGSMQEWALVKRHHTEHTFGVQLCANNPRLLTKCGQMLEQEIDVDFIDLNLGCPIELVYKEGAGCGLLRRPRVLESCVRNLSQILTIPLTLKTRTGVYSNENVAHTFMPKYKDWGASMVTVHGRSREQRYTKVADWAYIRECAQLAAPFPVLGNGDILSYEDYKTARESCPELASVMIGRGGLIKPWIFTEIKEQKIWDISSSERFEMIKKYVNYGLEHWGSDTKGVENTRRFLLEWLSFLHRYIPVGLLESPPQKINERPPHFRGRDDMETLMASTGASDWVKISEMLLGPVPEGFRFLPKHKANSYK